MGSVSCLLQNEGKRGCGTGAAGVYLPTVKMGSDSLLITVRRSVEDGLTAKGLTSFLNICETCLCWPYIVDGCGSSPGFGSGNKKLKCVNQLPLAAWWLSCRTPAAEAPVCFPRNANFISCFCHEIGV